MTANYWINEVVPVIKIMSGVAVGPLTDFQLIFLRLLPFPYLHQYSIYLINILTGSKLFPGCQDNFTGTYKISATAYFYQFTRRLNIAITSATNTFYNSICQHLNVTLVCYMLMFISVYIRIYPLINSANL